MLLSTMAVKRLMYGLNIIYQKEINMKFLNWLKEFFAVPATEVKNIVVEGAEEVAAQTKDKVTKIKRKRARNKKGRFIADDPTTSKNEAYEDSK